MRVRKRNYTDMNKVIRDNNTMHCIVNKVTSFLSGRHVQEIGLYLKSLLGGRASRIRTIHLTIFLSILQIYPFGK